MDVTQGRLASPDWLMIGGYFVLMLGIGAYFAGRMRRMKDYFSGGNTIPWWLSGVSFYMSSFSVAAFVIVYWAMLEGLAAFWAIVMVGNVAGCAASPESSSRSTGPAGVSVRRMTCMIRAPTELSPIR